MITRKRTAGAILAVLAYAGGSLAVLELASATEQERITLAEGTSAEREYPPIPGNDPAGEFIHPDSCRTAEIVCDVIPFTILPQAEPGSEFLFRINVFWEAEDTPGTSLQSNDLDLYIWTDPPGDNTITHTEEPGDANNPGASGRNPERLNLFLDQPGDYLLVVSNWVGFSSGYRLEAQYFSGELVAPFESLDPSFTPPEDRSGTPAPPPSSSGPPPSQSSGGGFTATPIPEAPAPQAAPESPTTPQTLALGDPADTSAFSEIGGIDESSFKGAPQTIPLRPVSGRAAADVPDAVLAAWFGGVPLVAAGLFGGLMLRNRRDVFAAARAGSAGSPA